MSRKSETYIDPNAQAVPVMQPLIAHKITSGSTAAKNSTAISKGAVVRIVSTEDIYFKFGDDTVEATTDDFFLLASTINDFAIGDNQYISVLQSEEAGTVHVIEFL